MPGIPPTVQIGKWLNAFEGVSDTGKTKRLVVVTKEGERLGEIRWRGAWHQYAFFPDGDTLYERRCLRDLSDFLERLMAERKRPEIQT